jgi:hypothetical protein
MALVSCKECGNKISKKAESCPQCGAKLKHKSSLGCLGLACVCFVTVAFVWNVVNDDPAARTAARKAAAEAAAVPKTPEQIRQETIEKGFRLNGAHRQLEKIVKASMHNPDSYKHVKTVYLDEGDHLIVFTTFRGTNAFGGVIANTVKARCDLNGSVLKIISQD